MPAPVLSAFSAMRGALRGVAQGHPRGVPRPPPLHRPTPLNLPSASASVAPQGCSSLNARTYSILASAAAKRTAAQAAKPQARPSINLGAGLKALLSSLLLLPSLRGALQVFSRAATTSAAPHARTQARSHYAHLARTSFKPAHRTSLRSSGPSFRVAPVPRSMTHGVGLQTARNFSSAGVPYVSEVVYNVPMVLRALADEADDQLRKGNKRYAKSQRSTVTATLKRQRKEATLAKRVQKFLDPVKVASPASSVGEFETLEEELASPSAVARAYAEYFAPATAAATAAPTTAEKSTKGPHPTRRTVLVMPADPHLALLIAPPSSSSTSHILDDFSSSVRHVAGAYATHRLLISALQELMQKHGLPVPFEEQLSLVPHAYSAHGLAWELEFEGWTKRDVALMLRAELGVRGEELVGFLFEEEMEVEEELELIAQQDAEAEAHEASPVLSELSFNASSPSSLASSELIDLGVDLQEFGAASWLSMNDAAASSALELDLELSLMGEEEVRDFATTHEFIMPTLDTSLASLPSPRYSDEELSSEDEDGFASSSSLIN